MVESIFAEIFCTSDSLLSGAVTANGGRAVQYCHWSGFDLTTKAGTDRLKEDLLGNKPRVVWMTLPCTTQRTQQSLTRSRFLWLVKQDRCEAILEEMWSSARLGRGGVFFELKEKFQWQSTWMLVGVISLMEHFLQNLGTSSAHVDVGQICCVLDDVSMIILIKH